MVAFNAIVIPIMESLYVTNVRKNIIMMKKTAENASLGTPS